MHKGKWRMPCPAEYTRVAQRTAEWGRAVRCPAVAEGSRRRGQEHAGAAKRMGSAGRGKKRKRPARRHWARGPDIARREALLIPGGWGYQRVVLPDRRVVPLPDVSDDLLATFGSALGSAGVGWGDFSSALMSLAWASNGTGPWSCPLPVHVGQSELTGCRVAMDIIRPVPLPVQLPYSSQVSHAAESPPQSPQ